MSEKKPNWVDKANLASNLLQNIQLQELHSSLRVLGNLQDEQLRMALNEQQSREREDGLREGLWAIENIFNRFLEESGVTGCAMRLLAGEVHEVVTQSGVTTAAFSQFQDKDRLARFLERLEETRDSVGDLSDEEKANLVKYWRCKEEAQELTVLINWKKRSQEFSKRRKEVAAKKRMLKELRQKERARVENTNVVLSFIERLAGTVSAHAKEADNLQAQIEWLEKGIFEDEAQEPQLPNQHLLELTRRYEAKSVRDLLSDKRERDGFMETFRQSNGLPKEDFFQQNLVNLRIAIAGNAFRGSLSAEVQKLARNKDRKISAIKLYREQTGAGLSEAIKAVEDFIRYENRLKGKE